MDLQLNGKNILVTGAGQGVGRAIGEAFVAEGANVAFHYNTSGVGADEAAAAAVAGGATAMSVQADISSQADVDRMIAAVEGQLGSIDVLVNNAAFTPVGPFLELSADDLEKAVDVTVLGMMRITQAALRGMVARGDGSIVSLMGDSGRVGESRLAAVATTRSSTMGLMKSIAKEHGRDGIRANTISLGLVKSENFDAHTGFADDEKMQRIMKLYPVRRVGMPADIPPMVMLLASPLSAWVTGQTVSLNGGYSMV
jgi:NAD(P)-dependent dehydrogenase (short-subunit alcohol dehydrogenase family)